MVDAHNAAKPGPPERVSFVWWAGELSMACGAVAMGEHVEYVRADVHERVVAQYDKLWATENDERSALAEDNERLRAQLAASTERDWDALGRECLWRVLDAQSVPEWLRDTFGGGK
jgi:hypothetical protein